MRVIDEQKGDKDQGTYFKDLSDISIGLMTALI